MDANVRGDVIPLDDLNLTVAPSTDKVQIVGAFATNMSITHVILFHILVDDVVGGRQGRT